MSDDEVNDKMPSVLHKSCWVDGILLGGGCALLQYIAVLVSLTPDNEDEN